MKDKNKKIIKSLAEEIQKDANMMQELQLVQTKALMCKFIRERLAQIIKIIEEDEMD